MLLQDILHAGEYTPVAASSPQPGDISFTRIVTSTAELERGCLFVCLRGRRFDTHTALPLIAASGAAAIIAEEGLVPPWDRETPLFLVSDTHATLSRLFARFYSIGQKKSRLIAITGTNGKTSTLYILAALLSAAGYRVGMLGTVDILLDGKPLPLTEKEAAATRTMTTPDPAYLYPILCRMADAGADFIVMEASSHALALKKLLPLTFELGLFTNLSPEHMDFHRDMEEYLSAKASLFLLCKKGIFPAASPYTPEILRRTKTSAVLYGTPEECELVRTAVPEAALSAAHLSDKQAEGSIGGSFRLTWGKKVHTFHTSLAGLYNLDNAALAVTAALTLGLSPQEVAVGLSGFLAIPGRLERLTGSDDDITVLIDYAHTEAALRRLLEAVRPMSRGRIWLVFGCGGDRDKTKRAPMGTVAEMLADMTVVTSDNPRTESPTAIIRDILRGMPDKTRRRVRVDRHRAITETVMQAQPGDTVLLVGKGHETYEINVRGIRPFDERAIVRQALLSRNQDKKD